MDRRRLLTGFPSLSMAQLALDKSQAVPFPCKATHRGRGTGDQALSSTLKRGGSLTFPSDVKIVQKPDMESAPGPAPSLVRPGATNGPNSRSGNTVSVYCSGR